MELKFIGASERLRLEMPSSQHLASAHNPSAMTLSLEASRSALEVEAMPLEPGREVYVGFKRMHALQTPISSVRLVGRSVAETERLARIPLVVELTTRMHLEPLHYVASANEPERVRGLPVLALGPELDLGAPLEMLAKGARQVLATVSAEPRVGRMLLYVEPASQGRDAVLAAAASLARHLTVDVAMLVGDEEGSAGSVGRYRDLLDLRSAALRQHGLDIRTETFRGRAVDAIKERLLTSDEPTLLVVSLTSPEHCSELAEEVRQLLHDTPPAAVLLVSGRAEQDARVAPAPAYALGL
jgi:hypothetical protein